MLRGLLTPAFTVADRDYLINVGSEGTKQLFVPDSDKQLEILTKDKRSSDRASLVDAIGSAIQDGRMEELRA